MTLSAACRLCGALTEAGYLCLDCEAEQRDAAETRDAINRGEIDEAEAAPWRDDPATWRTL